MPKTDRLKSSPCQVPLPTSSKRWEGSVEREIERKSNFLLDLVTSPSTKYSRLPESLRLTRDLSLRLSRELSNRFLELVCLSVAPLMERVLKRLLLKSIPEN